MKTLSLGILAAASLFSITSASVAQAGTVTLDAPHAGASLHTGRIAMSVYFTRTDSDAFQVVATYAGKAEPDQPRRIVMALSDGDRVSFGLPGHRGALYTFARDGGVVTVSDSIAPIATCAESPEI